MKNRKPKLTLLKYVDRYLAERDVSPHHAERIRTNCLKLSEYSRRVLRVDQLASDLVNSWLVSLREKKLSAYTMAGYRGDILSVWNAAYVDEMNDVPPLRVRKIKKPRLDVKAYTHPEIQQLLSAAAGLRGYDIDGNKRSDFWQALIHAAYSTGLRRGDLLNLRRDTIAVDGLCTVIQHKTGYPVTVRLSGEAMESSAKLRPVRGLAFPWPYRIESLTSSFRRVREWAGINRGSFCWLRRSAGSYAESQDHGAGPRLLGHRDHGVFARHYEDRSIAAAKPVEPPRMAPPVNEPKESA